jgi:hypothetical protein
MYFPSEQNPMFHSRVAMSQNELSDASFSDCLGAFLVRCIRASVLHRSAERFFENFFHAQRRKPLAPAY